MTRTHRKRVVIVTTLVAVVGAVGFWMTRMNAGAQPSPDDNRQTVYTVERRPFRAVVTLDAQVINTLPVPIARRRPNTDVEWSAKSGDQVKAGQVIGWEVPSATDQAGGQSEVKDALDRALRQRTRLQQTTALDLADAKADVEQSAAADRPRAERALARLRLSSAQALDDLNGHIEELRQGASTVDNGRLPLTAPVDGTLAIPAAGAEATIQPTGYIITASVDPLVLYRLLDESGKPLSRATNVKLTGTTIQFACADLEMRSGPAPVGPTDTDAAQSAPGTTATASCKVPAGPRVFSGLDATLAITVIDLSEALVVDAAGVRGANGDKGLVSVRQPDGTNADRTVTLGPTDGLSVVITDGLNEGDQILDPAATS